VSAYARELTAAHEIAVAAAVAVRSYVGRPIHVDRKVGNEPVTEADHAANRIIVQEIERAFPDDVILSEEIPDNGARLGARRVWMVDPIDGTSDFILGLTGYAVMIGLCVDGRPMVGVVTQPLTGKTYAGVVGEGAWTQNDAPAPGQEPAQERAQEPAQERAQEPAQEQARDRTPLRTSTLERPPGIRLVASKTHRTSRIDAIRRALQIEDETNIGSVGLKIGLVAEAARDLYVYTGGRTKIWDTCGPEAILTAAGGRVTDVDGRPLDYTRPDPYNARGIVASNGPLHDHVINIIAPMLMTQID
jgi:3'(2'), 5'-bisphosphate nucleotidase